MSRFDYIKYDDKRQAVSNLFKELYTHVSSAIEAIPPGRAQSLALTKLEESYMWVGKALRDEQVKENAKTELNESRG